MIYFAKIVKIYDGHFLQQFEMLNFQLFNYSVIQLFRTFAAL